LTGAAISLPPHQPLCFHSIAATVSSPSNEAALVPKAAVSLSPFEAASVRQNSDGFFASPKQDAKSRNQE
jgi:hypothetical protein